MTTCVGQHVPGISPFQFFSTGVHLTHSNMALAPMMTVNDMMMNQIAHLIQPVDMRRTVMAKEVLLQRAARMEKVPATLETKTSRGKTLVSISHMCLP